MVGPKEYIDFDPGVDKCWSRVTRENDPRREKDPSDRGREGLALRVMIMCGVCPGCEWLRWGSGQENG